MRGINNTINTKAQQPQGKKAVRPISVTKSQITSHRLTMGGEVNPQTIEIPV
jgi:hypothetical protein